MKIATVISIIFEPLFVLAVILVTAGFKAQLSTIAFFQYLMVLVFMMIGPVLVMRLWLLKKHGIDWDIRDRHKRIKPLITLCGFAILDMFLIQFLRSPVLNQLFLLFIIWIAGFSLVTLKWKISGHSGVVALATGIMVRWFGWQWWPLLLLVPLVGWSRVVRKDHTVLQVIMGAVYSFILLLFI